MQFLENLNNLLKMSKSKSTFSFDDEQSVSQEEFYSDIENLLCFERAIRFCYASMEMMVHNRTIRHQCQHFSKWSRTNEEELEKILQESPSSDYKTAKAHHPYGLPPDDLTMESVLSLGLVVAEHRLESYQELRRQLPVRSRIVLNQIIAHVAEEIKFFKREKEIVSVEGILNSLN